MVKNNDNIKKAVKLYAKYGLMCVVARQPQYVSDYWLIENLVENIDEKETLNDEEIKLISYYVPSGLYGVIDRSHFIDEKEIKKVTEMIVNLYKGEEQ